MTRTRAKKLRDKLAKEEKERVEAKKAVREWKNRLTDDAIFVLGGLLFVLAIGLIGLALILTSKAT